MVITALLALAARAGPLGFSDRAQFSIAERVADCGSCAYVTSYEALPEPSQSGNVLGILGYLTVLGGIGLVGVCYGVRTKDDGRRKSGTRRKVRVRLDPFDEPAPGGEAQH